MIKEKKQKTKGHVRPEDVIIGQNLRDLRTSRGMSQEDIADRTGVSFQQIQKYEKGTNRISASRLLQISNTLNCDILYLYRGLIDDNKTPFSLDTIKIAEMISDISDKETLNAIKKIILNLANKD